MVLLKNDGNLLPFDKGRIKSIAVIGPDACPAQPVGGGSGAVQPFAAVSFLQGIANYLGAAPKSTMPPDSDPERNGGADAIHHRIQRRQSRFESGVFRQHDSFRQARDRTRGPESQLRSRGDRMAWLQTINRSVGQAISRLATPGEYLVFVQGPGENGGYRLYIDKKIVIDDWTQAYAFLSQLKLHWRPARTRWSSEYFVRTWLGQDEIEFRNRAARKILLAQRRRR